MKKDNGIYKMTCTATGDFYVGKAVNIKAKRWSNHKNELKNQKHNKKVNALVDEYGYDCWKFEILEHCHKYELWELEKKFIEELQPTLNVILDAKEPHITATTKKKMREKMSLSQRGENNPMCTKLNEEKVIQIKLLIKDGKKTYKEISEMFDVTPGYISAIATDKKWKHVRLEDYAI